MLEEKKFKKEVLTAFQKVSPSKIAIENDAEFDKYLNNLYNLFFYKLKFPPELFMGKKVIDFGCGTGEVDVLLAHWGAKVEGFDFNEISIKRANENKERFFLQKKLDFFPGDVDTYEFLPEAYQIVMSLGVIAHVPFQKRMFQRMGQACQKKGYVVLGYIEKSGLIQRLLHRAICLANADQSESRIYETAHQCFGEHIDRSVKYGGRTAESVINDYLINPHYHGIDAEDLLQWAEEAGLEYYSSWPDFNVPFGIDSPYFKPMSKFSMPYKQYLAILKLRWIFAQYEDAKVLSDLTSQIPDVSKPINEFLNKMDDILQNYNYRSEDISKLGGMFSEIEESIKQSFDLMQNLIENELKGLGQELIRIVRMIIEKSCSGKDFDLNTLNHKLFKGYNGLGTSYIVFHKK